MTALLQVRGAAPAEVSAAQSLSTQVVSLRHRWYIGLDAGGWDRDDPAIRALADGLTTGALNLLDRARLHRAAVEHRALDHLIAEMGGAAARERFERQPIEHAHWIEAWLRWGGERSSGREPMLEQLALEEHTLPAIAMWAPAHAVSRLRADPAETARGRSCEAMLSLPLSARERVVELLAPLAASPPAAPSFAACIAALISVPRAHRLAAQWFRASYALARPERPASAWGHDSHALELAVALSGSPQGAEARARLPSLLAIHPRGRDAPLTRAANFVARYAPWLRASPALTQSARQLAIAADGSAWPLLSARLRWRDPTVFGDSRAVVSAPGSRDMLTVLSARALAVFTPAAAAERAPSRLALTNFAAATARRAHPGIGAGDLQRAIAALDATPCASEACLVEVFGRGSDERAAREVALLGARGLSALRGSAARALVARVVRRGRVSAESQRSSADLRWSATAWATFLVVEGCPLALRGMREAGLLDPFSDLLVTPWRDAFARACRDGSSRSEP